MNTRYQLNQDEVMRAVAQYVLTSLNIQEAECHVELKADENQSEGTQFSAEMTVLRVIKGVTPDEPSRTD